MDRRDLSCFYYCVVLSSVFASCFSCSPDTQHGQEILGSLAKLKFSIMTRYEQYEQGLSSLNAQAPVFNPIQQLSVAHRSINFHGINTLTSSSTSSISRSRTSILPRSHIHLPKPSQSPFDLPRSRRSSRSPFDLPLPRSHRSSQSPFDPRFDLHRGRRSLQSPFDLPGGRRSSQSPFDLPLPQSRRSSQSPFDPGFDLPRGRRSLQSPFDLHRGRRSSQSPFDLPRSRRSSQSPFDPRFDLPRGRRSSQSPFNLPLPRSSRSSQSPFDLPHGRRSSQSPFDLPKSRRSSRSPFGLPQSRTYSPSPFGLPRSSIPSPSPCGNDRPLRDHEEPRQSEEVYPADGACAQQWSRKWEEEGWRRMTEQRRQEEDGILWRHGEAEHAAQAARCGQSTYQNYGVTIAPVSVQYPNASALGSSGPVTGYLQMPIELERWVTSLGHTLVHAFLVLKEPKYRPRLVKPNKT